ncbi:DUF2332 domain-containing protein [Microbacterium invictum]|uniref:DUF2332 domain-containing protein n=1 Tax=Microbacterium invictum TaxID=515415 RepID=A0AA40SLS9_9MICO|nr:MULTISPECIES: DUF2332 domain-containing protein [Microbacterium]MBB4138492.1 hypothetical protein [Microbacterium invictum]
MGQMRDAGAAVADRYDRFARREAPGRSELYAQWAAGAAADEDVCDVLARIPASHRQPPLVFAVSRLLGVGEPDYPTWRRWLLENADQVVAECGSRSLQTNEPLRCAALLPALSRIPGPIALLEVGASAGLCLYPDRYSYRYAGGEGEARLDPAAGPSTVELTCEVTGSVPPVALPEIVWRAGIDLNPLDPALPGTADWLTGLVWPGETGRAERVRAALEIAAADPPRLVAGDAPDVLAQVAASAPRDATLVVTTPGVLAHIPHADRLRTIAAARAAGRWITLDDPGLHDAWSAPIDPGTWPGGFALALDGEVLAAADPLGGSLEWLPGAHAHAG